MFFENDSSGIERHEAKYIIHPDLLPQIREFIRPFVLYDRHAQGEPPRYTVTTLQLDTHDDAFYRAKEVDSINRFKLRVRTYGLDGSAPVVLEVKQKIRGVVVKLRAIMSQEDWDDGRAVSTRRMIHFDRPDQEYNYLQFRRLCTLLDAAPAVRVRYERESYIGAYDNYARVTLDSNLRYQEAESWRISSPQKRWWRMDSSTALDRDFSGVVLELKTFDNAPLWMIELVEKFDLARSGFCKYYTARRLNAIYSGENYWTAAEDCGY
jgi:hypothetical protein